MHSGVSSNLSGLVMPPPSPENILSAVDKFLCAFFRDSTTSAEMLEYFSTSYLITIQHAPQSCCPEFAANKMQGHNAVRSYFDLLTTHWYREALNLDDQPHIAFDHSLESLCTVAVDASIRWTWRRTRRQWTEDLNCAITLDDNLKIVSLIFRTLSSPETCVMYAKDLAGDRCVPRSTALAMVSP